MKRIALIAAFALIFLLPGCGKTLDAETLELLEASDAVCRVEARLYTYSNGDVVMECRVKEDYLGNISTRGRDLNFYDRVYVYVEVEEAWYTAMRKEYYGHDLILFLDLREEEYRDRRWHLFVPRGGEESIRLEGWDGAGLRYMEALGDYGKKHPRAVESWTFQYPEGIWSYIPSYYT